MTPISEAAKAYVAMAGALATALLGTYGPDTPIGRMLTLVVAAATGVATYEVANRPPGREPSSPSPP